MNKIINQWEYDGITYELTWIPDADLNEIKPLTQSYGFCFDKNNKLLVIETSVKGSWQVPGGTIEPGETPIETLHREIVEEANTTIKEIVYLGAQKVRNPINGYVSYQLRYAAKIDKLLKRSPDPDKGKILKRKLIDPKIYNKLADWGEIGEELVRVSIERLKINE